MDHNIYLEEHWYKIFQTSQDNRVVDWKNLSWMGTFVFWNTLLTSKILAVSLCISAIAMLILYESECATGLYDWSKSIPLIWELPFSQWRATNFHASEQSPSLILGAISDHGNFLIQGGNWLGWELKEG